ncbi:MAG: recombinase RecT [Methylothermaceae bacterium]|nr:recombinase RecT [Methylothermaceae bacterium]
MAQTPASRKQEGPLPPLKEIIQKSKDGFIQADSGLDFRSEAVFAFQALERNEYLRDTALRNPISLRLSMENVAAVRLTLNPATQFAFLVPRDGAVVLDISYRGLIKIATDSGSILWARAELVYEDDKFEWRGPAQAPVHETDIFAEDRGAFRGVYCLAKTPQNDILVEAMPAHEVHKIRDTSRAKKGPWVTWFEEMARKSVIKRASKTWPKGDLRLFKAIQILNQHEGLDEPHLVNQGEAQTEPERTERKSPPSPPPSSEVSETVKKAAAKLCYRAAKAGAWEEAEEYAGNRYEGAELAFVLDQLNRAKASQAKQEQAA